MRPDPFPRPGGAPAGALSGWLHGRMQRARRLRRMLIGGVNLRGELFSAAATFAAMSTLRLLSSLILTRLLYPEAYGIIAILASALYVIEMLSDIGAIGLVVRHERAEEPRFLDTVWTMRMLRSMLNGGIVFALAPWIAALYGDSALTDPLRVLAPWFLFSGIETMSFALARRRQRSRIVGFVELGTSAVSTVFVIAWSQFSRDHWGMVYGMLLQRALYCGCSYFFGPPHRPRFTLDRQAARAVFDFSKFVMPTSMLTMLLGQYDKFVFLRLFDMKTLGVYGVAGSVGMPIGALMSRITQFVLYPRCAQVYREQPQALQRRFYTDNVKLLAMLGGFPALVGGAAPQIVELLFDPRYAAAGFVLQMYMFRMTVGAWHGSSQTLLTAVGQLRAPLISNLLRLAWLLPASLIGYHFMGFKGFVVGAMLDVVPAAGYTLWVQHRKGLLLVRFELWRLALAVVAWAGSAGVATLIASTGWWATHFR